MPATLSDGFYRAAVLNSSTKEAVVLDLMLPPGTIQKREDRRTVGDGSQQVMRREYELLVELLEVDETDLLEDWADNDEAVEVVLLGTERHVQWEEAVTPNIRPVRNGVRSHTTNALRVFTGLKDPAVYQHKNLVLMEGWRDLDGDGVADGWSLSGEDSSSFSGKEQSITGSADVEFKRTVTFPFSGEEYAALIDLTDPHDNGTVVVRLEFTGSGGGVIQTEEATASRDTLRTSSGEILRTSSDEELTVSGTGGVEITGTTPNRTRQIRFIVKLKNVSGSADFTFRFPTLRNDQVTDILRY